jgi:phenylalanyl-tRNA synthetase beta chain
MPTITVSRQELHRLAERPPGWPLAELDLHLALVKGELNSRTLDGTSLRQPDGQWLDGEGDYALRIELKDTNRPDLWSIEGIARQLRDHARGYGAEYLFFTGAPQTEQWIEVDPVLATIRPFIGGFLVTGNRLDEAGLLALIEAQETLTDNFGRKRKTVSIGFYAGDQLAFPVRYAAVEPQATHFVPLPPATPPADWPHGIALTLAEILETHPTGRDYGSILAGHERVPFLTDATGAALSFPPIINSAGLGRVTPGMTALFVEATGTEQDQVLLALNILATNLADRGWSIQPVTTRYPYETPRGQAVTVPQPMHQTQSVAVSEFARLLGEPIPGAEIVRKLTAYGVTASAEQEIIRATAPGYRQDYLHAVDVIEDYAISRGYDLISPTLAQAFTVGRLEPLTEFEDLVRDLLIGFGFEEAICNILTSETALRGQMNVRAGQGAPPFHGGPAVRIDNVMNLNYSTVRDWIIPSLLEIEAQSAGALYPHRLFEVGEVAVFDESATLGSRTEARLAGLIAEEAVAFDRAQSVVYALLGKLKRPFRVVHWAHPSFIEGRVGLVLSEDKPATGENSATPMPLGFLGELSPQVLTAWGVRMPAVAFEFSLDALWRAR